MVTRIITMPSVPRRYSLVQRLVFCIGSGVFRTGAGLSASRPRPSPSIRASLARRNIHSFYICRSCSYLTENTPMRIHGLLREEGGQLYCLTYFPLLIRNFAAQETQPVPAIYTHSIPSKAFVCPDVRLVNISEPV
jgi:hypothetical protein